MSSPTHFHGPETVPRLDLPPPFPARGTQEFTYLVGPPKLLESETWKRPDGTIFEQRIYAYNPNRTVSSIVRRVYDLDGTTIVETFTYSYAYAGAMVSSVTVT